jgi:hypothetical protein
VASHHASGHRFAIFDRDGAWMPVAERFIVNGLTVVFDTE